MWLRAVHWYERSLRLLWAWRRAGYDVDIPAAGRPRAVLRDSQNLRSDENMHPFAVSDTGGGSDNMVPTLDVYMDGTA